MQGLDKTTADVIAYTALARRERSASNGSSVPSRVTTPVETGAARSFIAAPSQGLGPSSASPPKPLPSQHRPQWSTMLRPTMMDYAKPLSRSSSLPGTELRPNSPGVSPVIAAAALKLQGPKYSGVSFGPRCVRVPWTEPWGRWAPQMPAKAGFGAGAP
eukprot:gnl/MRDRNA2_/MRDRNA2_105193_c0_seq1.p1 gnl/MRDRNA2_/MRDRNA2_105193_c0~~gnl/MRDRNA2_/MRDRNA2_105193_c0_seq1.p1  ORF type:complete len:159 (+),score=9.34 gnl/MRDRNA2_/MRDRNA2_105193_c0_seq1:58-534(+)